MKTILPLMTLLSLQEARARTGNLRHLEESPVAREAQTTCERTINPYIAQALATAGAVSCDADWECDSGCCLQEYCYCHQSFTGGDPADYLCANGVHPDQQTQEPEAGSGQTSSPTSGTPGPTPGPTPSPVPGPSESCERTIESNIAEAIFEIGGNPCEADWECDSGCCLKDYCYCHETLTANSASYFCMSGVHPGETSSPTPGTGSTTSAPTPDPTPGSTPSPTPEATPGPTPSPTPGTTPPTPDPTHGSTPGPTPEPTPDPTLSPTPGTTPSPTPEPTPGSTSGPTPKPTPDPTSSPTLDETPDTGAGQIACERGISDYFAQTLAWIGAVACINDDNCAGHSGCCLSHYCFCMGTFSGDNPENYVCSSGKPPNQK